MKELIEPVPGFELTTGILIKHFKDISETLRYDIVEESFDGMTYKDLILYIPSGNSKTMWAIKQARQEVLEELTNTPSSFMGDYSNYTGYADKFEKSNVFGIRKYDNDFKGNIY